MPRTRTTTIRTIWRAIPALADVSRFGGTAAGRLLRAHLPARPTASPRTRREQPVGDLNFASTISPEARGGSHARVARPHHGGHRSAGAQPTHGRSHLPGGDDRCGWRSGD